MPTGLISLIADWHACNSEPFREIGIRSGVRYQGQSYSGIRIAIRGARAFDRTRAVRDGH
jgi:hypothetical protein